MNKQLVVLILLATTLMGSARKPIYTADPTPSPAPSGTPLGTQVLGGVSFAPVVYYSTQKEREIITRAGKLAYDVIQSKCAYDFISKRKMIETEGRTSEEVAKHLQSLRGVVPVVMYYRCMKSFKCPFGTSAVAYRNPPEVSINLNRAVFYDGLSDCEWAETLAHESIGHSLGEYGHSFEWTAKRDFSVPYSIGGASQKNGSVFQSCCDRNKVKQ